MPLFETKIKDLRQGLSSYSPDFREVVQPGYRFWPRVNTRQMILEQDMGVELGNGRLPSFAIVLWTEDLSQVEDGIIRIFGQDIPQIAAPNGTKSVPFGKVALLGVDAIAAEEAYPAFEQMDAVRFNMNLNGYMLRGLSQRNREWSRVSTSACHEGFSFAVLGSELIHDYKKLPFVKSAEMMFFTESALIQELMPLAEDCTKITSALNTMFENIDMDCKNCDAADICDDVDELRKLHNKLRAE